MRPSTRQARSPDRSSAGTWIPSSGICACCAAHPLPKFTQPWRARPCSTCRSNTKSPSIGFSIGREVESRGSDSRGLDSHGPGEQGQHRKGKRCRSANGQRENCSGIEVCGRQHRTQQDQRKRRDPRPKKNERAERQQNARNESTVAKSASIAHQQQDSGKENKVIVDRLPGKNGDRGDGEQKRESHPEGKRIAGGGAISPGEQDRDDN